MATKTSSLDQSQNYSSVHLDYLPIKARRIVSEKLNNKKCIRSENGSFCRDWRGILELCGLQKSYYDTVEKSLDPMEELLRQWCKNVDNVYPKANLEIFRGFLEEIDRYDVFDDILETIGDIEEFEGRTYEKFDQPEKSYLPDEKSDALTIQDLERLRENKPLKLYDAFVLFEDEDSDFVERLYGNLPNYSLCKKSDLMAQTFEHTALVNLIEKRCRRVVAVISRHFLNSSSNANRFLVDFAQAEQIESGSLRIVPVVIEKEVERSLPSNLKFLHKLYYYKDSNLYDFWKILDSTLMDKSSFNTRSALQNCSNDSCMKNDKLDEPTAPPPLPEAQSVQDLTDELTLPPKHDLTDSANLKETVILKRKKWYKIFRKNKTNA